MRQLSLTDAAWVLLESRDTPMHVGGLFEFTPPPEAPATFLRDQLDEWLRDRAVPSPWNLRLARAPVVGHRLPLMREEHDVDLDYHVRRSALPAPGGQRELGILVSRLHSNQLDLHRPLWEAHFIEGLEGGRFAMYMKLHHALIDGVSGVRLILECFTDSPSDDGAAPFWLVGEQDSKGPSRRPEGAAPGLIGSALASADKAAEVGTGLARAAIDLSRASVDSRPLSAPFRSPDSPLRSRLTGQRRLATQQYELARIKELARAAGCTINDIVLWLCGTALRRYLAEHGRVPDTPLTAGIPVSLRDSDDTQAGTAIASMVAELGTNVADPGERLARIAASTAAAKEHLERLPRSALAPYLVFANAPYLAGLTAGLGERAPIPFSLSISNIPGPKEPLYMNGARLDSIFPVSMLLHGNALNITCVSYAGTINFGFIGARDALPHLQRLALYMADALDELGELLATRST